MSVCVCGWGMRVELSGWWVGGGWVDARVGGCVGGGVGEVCGVVWCVVCGVWCVCVCMCMYVCVCVCARACVRPAAGSNSFFRSFEFVLRFLEPAYKPGGPWGPIKNYRVQLFFRFGLV